LIEGDFGAVVLGRGGFFGDAVPEVVGFGKGGFDVPGWEEGFDVCGVSTVIAGMRADALSDVFLDRRHKVVQAQAIESKVCSLEAASQR